MGYGGELGHKLDGTSAKINKLKSVSLRIYVYLFIYIYIIYRKQLNHHILT
jgi:hypothetical protein